MNALKLLLGITILFACLLSCEKDTFSIESPPILEKSNGGNKNDDIPSGAGETVLGEELSNPYDLQNINQAYTMLSGKSGNLQATHYYLKLLPSTDAHLATIGEYEEAHGYEFELQPIHFEVKYEGDQGYQGPDINSEFAPEYGAITAKHYSDGVLPQDVPYEILNIMHIPVYESRLTFTAFVISGNERYYEAVDGYCHPDCPTWPYCLDDTAVACDVPANTGSALESMNPYSKEPRINFPDYIKDAKLGYKGDVTPLNNIPTPIDDCPPGCVANFVPVNPEPPYTEFEWICECSPPGSGGNGPPSGQVEECGCFVYDDSRKPGGRIILDDSQLGEEGVRRVKVKTTKHYWGFLWSNTDTDDNGCWKINRRYNVRRMKTKVVFKDRVSDRIVIRSFRGARFWNAFLKPVKTPWYIRRNNRQWNDLCLVIDDETDPEQQTNRKKQSFIAATTNNAVHEFYSDFGLNLPGAQAGNGKLSILINTFGDGANAAPMFREMDQEQFDESDLNSFFFGLLGGPIGPLATIISLYWEASKPDVLISFGSNRPSDRIKRIVYHELTHVAQYTKVGAPWWLANFYYLVGVTLNSNNQPLPYGDGSLQGSGRTELIEGMAEAAGNYVTDEKYGLSHSNGGGNIGRWNNVAERLTFWPGAGGNNFIPEGLFFDLFDENGVFPTGVAAGAEPGFVLDKVSNFDFATQLNAFSPNIITIESYRDALFQQSGMSTGNNLTDYTTLFNSYGF